MAWNCTGGRGNMSFWNIFFGVGGGLGVFLLGMKHMSDGMQAVAGNRLRSMINSVTNNRLMGCMIGAAVTSLIQSSSVTTVMLVGFVNAGVMTFTQTIGVILGADIGTTITGWILVLPIAKYGLPIFGFSAFFYLFSKKERVRFTAMMLMGLGMVFYGMQLMKLGMDPLKETEHIVEWFARFSPDSLVGLIKCVLVGSVVTAVVQSSSATVGITMALAASGMIDFKTAVALVLGQNIGTTITAFLASLGTSAAARRTAYAHIAIKVSGVSLAILLFNLYFPFVEWMMELIRRNGGEISVRAGVALAHTAFNIALVICFLPFTRLLARGLERLFPSRVQEEIPHLTYLDVRMLETPAIGLEQSRQELKFMAESVDKMLERLRLVMTLEKPDEELELKLFQREDLLDDVQKEITEFVARLLSGNVARDVVRQARMQIRMADEYESISDYIVTILKMNIKLRKNSLKFSSEGRDEMLALHDRVAEFVKIVNEALESEQTDELAKTHVMGNAITHRIKEYREGHMIRLEKEATVPLTGLVFPDMLNSYRRIKDHAFNIVELLEGEK
ncbi:MAG: Na/Pi cotransporter family protein [Candidatus Aminicenantes bacterium]|nr:Na/Pi cotransporter family protein [Candidatus Aminicenantes bacterium]